MENKPSIPKEIQDEAEKRYPEHISVVGNQSDRKQRKNQRIFLDGYSLAASQISKLEGEVYAVREGAEQWEQEYNDCRKILQLLVDESKANTSEAPYNLIRLYKEAETFLSKYQHL